MECPPIKNKNLHSEIIQTMLAIHTNTYRIEEIEGSETERYFLLTVNNRPYKVGEMVYLILQGIFNKLSYQEIAQQLNLWSGKELYSESDLKNIVSEKLTPLGVFDIATSAKVVVPQMSGIYFRKKMLDIRHYEWFLKIFQALFTPWAFFSVLTLAIIANVILMNELLSLDHYVNAYNSSAVVAGDCLRGYKYIFSFYPIIVSILLIHELGHAAASYRFGVKSKEIGFGLYIIFPVLYTDVTEVWRISKLKRVIVNLGGIYFQLLINLGLIYGLYMNFGSFENINTFRYLIQINLATILINVVPFLKFDGYWLYSDIFSLPNLKQQSTTYFAKLLKFLIPKLPFKLGENSQKVKINDLPLMIYSISRYIFLAYFMVWAFIFFFKQIGSFPITTWNLITDCSVCTFEPFLRSGLNLGLFLFFAKNYYKSIREYISNYLADKRK
jgi:putative peptide zinc metalloprotease protein